MLALVEGSKNLRRLCREYETESVTVHLKELVGGAFSLYAAATIRRTGGVHVFVAEDRDAALPRCELTCQKTCKRSELGEILRTGHTAGKNYHLDLICHNNIAVGNIGNNRNSVCACNLTAAYSDGNYLFSESL